MYIYIIYKIYRKFKPNGKSSLTTCTRFNIFESLSEVSQRARSHVRRYIVGARARRAKKSDEAKQRAHDVVVVVVCSVLKTLSDVAYTRLIINRRDLISRESSSSTDVWQLSFFFFFFFLHFFRIDLNAHARICATSINIIYNTRCTRTITSGRIIVIYEQWNITNVK